MEITCIVTAHNESPHLPACLDSLLAQKLTCRIKLFTSTPNAHITDIAKTRGIEVIVAPNYNQTIGQNWNMAYQHAEGPLVALCHQDDVYLQDFTESSVLLHQQHPDLLMSFSRPAELVSSGIREANTNLTIKRMLTLWAFGQAPISVRLGHRVKRRLLSLGNPINCPSVVFAKDLLPNFQFLENLRSNLDWEAWDRILSMPGKVGYIDRVLVLHRVHEGSETSFALADSARQQEDLWMFEKFWPRWMAKLLMLPYRVSYQSNAKN